MMNKYIIYSENIETLKNICNIIFTNFNEVNKFKIVTDKSELVTICKTNEIHLIVLSEENLNDKIISNLIKKINNRIIFCENTGNFRNTKNTLHLPINASSEYIQINLLNFKSTLCEKYARIQIKKILKNLKFDFKLKGSSLFLEALVYSFVHKDEYLFENLEKQIYPYIAKKCHVDSQTIKWAIIRAVNSISDKVNPADFDIYTEKITPKSLIYIIINQL